MAPCEGICCYTKSRIHVLLEYGTIDARMARSGVSNAPAELALMEASEDPSWVLDSEWYKMLKYKSILMSRVNFSEYTSASSRRYCATDEGEQMGPLGLEDVFKQYGVLFFADSLTWTDGMDDW